MAFAGMEWIIVIVVIVLLLFGAKKIPELARSIGKARAEFTRGQAMVEKEIREADRIDREEDANREREETKRMAEEAPSEVSEEADDIAADPEIVKAAVALGIDPKGKTDEELRVLVKYKMEQG
jgi:sec-independent protein translocase protein TatA